jgi:protein ImuB
MTIGCLVVPHLPLQALRRAEPQLADGSNPVAVVEGDGSRAHIVDASAKAVHSGISPGLSVSEALALCPRLIARRLDPVLFESARAAVLDAASRVSPRIEEAEPGTVWVDADGLHRIWGDGRKIASALVSCAYSLGLLGKASVAPGKHLARLAARRGEGIAVVAEGAARSHLSRWPLESLSPEPALLETLRRWGVRTAGEFASLPADGVGTRLGQAGLRLHRLCCGEDAEPLVPASAPESFEEGLGLEHAVDRVEPLLFLLRPALERLLARLESRGQACGALTLRFDLDSHGVYALPIGLAGPTKSVGDLLRLCQLALEKRPPQESVCGGRLIAEPARFRSQQLGLWDLPSTPPSQLYALVSQLSSLVGAHRVGQLELLDSHLPEASGVKRFEPPPAASRLARTTKAQTQTRTRTQPPSTTSSISASASAQRPGIGLRRFRPPRPAEVNVGPRGEPLSLVAMGVRGRIVSYAGPFRLEVNWHGEPTVRDSYDVQIGFGGSVYLLAREGAGTWHLLGKYD